jgi:uncharacterized OB-fold protein
MSASVPPHPAPEPSDHGAPYWAAAREHRLVLQHCPRCDRLQHFPRPWCTECLADELDVVESSGRGTVYAVTVVRRNPNPAFAARVPYALALVDLDEGVRVMSNVVGCDPGSVHVGRRVTVAFESAADGAVVPVFTPIDDGSE